MGMGARGRAAERGAMRRVAGAASVVATAAAMSVAFSASVTRVAGLVGPPLDVTAPPGAVPLPLPIVPISKDEFTGQQQQQNGPASVVAAQVNPSCPLLELQILSIYENTVYAVQGSPTPIAFVDVSCSTFLNEGIETTQLTYTVLAPPGTTPATQAIIQSALQLAAGGDPNSALGQFDSFIVLTDPIVPRPIAPTTAPTASPTKAPTTEMQAGMPPEIGCCPNLQRWLGECDPVLGGQCWGETGKNGVPGVCGATKGGWFADQCVKATTFHTAQAMCQTVNADLCSAAELPATEGTGCDFSNAMLWTREQWNLQTGRCGDKEHIAYNPASGTFECTRDAFLGAVACCASATCPTPAPTAAPTAMPTAAPTRFVQCCEEIAESVKIFDAAKNWTDPLDNADGVCTSRAGGWLPGVCTNTNYVNSAAMCASVGAALCTREQFGYASELEPGHGLCDPNDYYWIESSWPGQCPDGERPALKGDGTGGVKCLDAGTIQGTQCCALGCFPPPLPTATPTRGPGMF